jgi:hypothetical protein
MPLPFGIPGPLLVASIAVIAGGVLLTTSPLENNNPSNSPDSLISPISASALPLKGVEHFKSHERAGDGTMANNFLRNIQEYVDPEGHCEFCSRFEYRPGPSERAGFVYNADRELDLTGAKRVTFWAMSEDEGVELSFLVAGKGLTKISESANNRAAEARSSGIFDDMRFAAVTENTLLTKEWKKYQINTDSLDMQDIRHVFGFEISQQKGASNKVFYLKGVTFDEESAEQPLSLLDQRY